MEQASTSSALKQPTYNGMNGHAVGIIMKEIVRRAIKTIRNERQAFEVTNKLGYGGAMDDLFTTADTKSQAVVLKSLRECFPDFGIVAEEDSLRIEPQNGETGYFTIDPLDGTKAFVREQSHGIGSMLAMVVDGKVEAAVVGDINTQELFYYRPGSDNVHRITDYETARKLEGPKGDPRKFYALLRDPVQEYGIHAQQFIGRCQSHIVDGGSIGIWMARLWKNEVGVALIPQGKETPWDSSPVIGITQKLGFRHYRPSKEGMHWEAYEPEVPTHVADRKHDTLIIHPDYAETLGLGR